MSDEIEIALLTATFDAVPGREETLLSDLSRYVVLTRHEPACRNVDLVASVTHGGRFLVIEKWDSAAALQAHLDSQLMTEMGVAPPAPQPHPPSQLMTEMAKPVPPPLASNPAIDMYDSISAHDLN